MKPCIFVGPISTKSVRPLLMSGDLTVDKAVYRDIGRHPQKINIAFYIWNRDHSKPECCMWYNTFGKTTHRSLDRSVRYSDKTYYKFTGTDIINVDSMNEIPYDYDGIMGVPMSVLYRKWDDIEIIEESPYYKIDIPEKAGSPLFDEDEPVIKHKYVFVRILVKIKRNNYEQKTYTE